MTEHVIVDGYNAIFRLPRLASIANADLERARGELLRLVQSLAKPDQRCTVVFDGVRQPAASSARVRGVKVVFSKAPETADARIHALVDAERRRSASSRRLAVRVVSSDEEVCQQARLWGAKAVRVEEFFATMAPQQPNISASPAPPAQGTRERDPGADPRPRAAKRELDQLESLFRRDAELDDEG